jgi:hypothetical protein
MPVHRRPTAYRTGLDGGNVTGHRAGMALTNAQKQKRYRERRKAADQTTPDALEQALLQEVERCGRGEMSDQERTALADKLTALALKLQERAIRLSRMGWKIRTGKDHPLSDAEVEQLRVRWKSQIT